MGKAGLHRELYFRRKHSYNLLFLIIGAAIYFTLNERGNIRSHIVHASFSRENECNHWQQRSYFTLHAPPG